MRSLVSSLLIIVLILPASGCATLKNMKIPPQFTELGLCPSCRQVIAADGLSDDEIAVCPECNSTFLVRDAKYRFRKKCVDLKNRKAASGVLAVALLAASVAGAVYGIPVPPPPISEGMFVPYKLPALISCRRAHKALSDSSEIYTKIPGFRPASSSRPDPRRMYESPYSVVIEDLYYDDYMPELNIAPYYISLGRLNSDRYDRNYLERGIIRPAF